MNYLNILDCSIADGEGVRIVLFVSGCPHHCLGCHNPESWNFNAGKEFTDSTLNKIYELLNRKYIDGLTISGGEPLSPQNKPQVLDICKSVKEKFPDKNIWVYTGYKLDDEQMEELKQYIDVVVDGEFIQNLRDITLPFRGSSNQRILYQFSNNHMKDNF